MDLYDAEVLAIRLFIKHGLDEKGWMFEWDGAVRRFGQCRYRDKVITLSEKLTLLNNEATVKNVILHEIAHALNDPRTQAHGREWKRIALSIGCDGKARYSFAHVTTPPKKFVGQCPNCERLTFAHRRNKVACGDCCRRFNNGRWADQFKINWNVTTV